MRRARKLRVLYLAFYFPPSRGSGVYRTRATANLLAKRGWDVTTFAVPTSFLTDAIGSGDESLLATVDPRVKVVRPDFRQFKWNQNVREFSWFRRHFPVLARNLHVFGQERVFPEAYVHWGVSAVRRALRMHARNRFDLVVASGNPFVSFAAAWWIGKLARIPYVVDYRDCWTLNQFTEEPMFPPEHGAWAWEDRVLRDAALSVFVNEGMRSWHAEKYPKYADRMFVALNGWDPELLELPEPPAAEDAPPGTVEGSRQRNRPLRFNFLGTITSVQPLEELITAFEIARQHPDLADAELNLYGYMGFFRNSGEELKRRMGITPDSPDNGVHFRGPVPKTEVGGVYEDSDVLVFMTGGGKFVTTGKIFEYIATGHPIVSVHLPGIAAAEILREYPLWFTAGSLDVNELANSMVAAGKAARDLTPEQRVRARRVADSYTRDAVLTPLENRLRQIVENPKDHR